MAELKAEDKNTRTAQFKDLIAKDAQANQAKYYESDIQRIAEDDYYCHRFLNYHQFDVNKSVKLAIGTLEWRKEFGVQEIGENDFKEVLEPPALIPFGQDREGNENIIYTVKNLQADNRLLEANMKEVVYIFEKMDRRGMDKGISLVVDCQGAGLSNINMTLVRFAVDLMMKYYPLLLRSIQVVDMPLIFTAIWTLVKSLLPKALVKNVKFVNKRTVLEYTEARYLPVCVGGTEANLIKFDVKSFTEQYKQT